MDRRSFIRSAREAQLGTPAHYYAALLIFWAAPRMTVGHLLIAVAMTAYILIAVRHEERDLVSLHGSDYVQYRRRVPMLFPRPGQRRYTLQRDPR